ncbi:MAG: dephospho-CoA kinase [Magnetococcales bacterium]|nr:dephospho-CoA kinase [Magnetococcales bacterium]MBF0115718.1 dephospho-CoA kinase [Magnetococcales bacterium]
MVSRLTAGQGGQLLLVAVTGSLGCGKSRVSRWLAEQGGYLLDADQEARAVLQPGTPGWQAVLDHFGPEILLASPHPAPIDRRRLGEIVFADPVARTALEAMIHPRIYQRQAQQLLSWQQATPVGQTAIVVAEVPLLFEAAIAHRFDRSVVVLCAEQQMERLRERNQMSDAVKQAVIAQQLSEQEKEQRAWYCIDNRSAWPHTEAQLQQLWRRLRGEAAHHRVGVWPEHWPERKSTPISPAQRFGDSG